jgi:hypothetical protein
MVQEGVFRIWGRYLMDNVNLVQEAYQDAFDWFGLACRGRS